MVFGLDTLDYVALAGYVVCWVAAEWLITHRARSKPSVHDLSMPLRAEWMRQAQRRDNRIADAGFIGHLIHSATFFVSTTALILLGLVALLGTADKSVSIVRNLPLAHAVSTQEIEIKTLVLVLVFVLAFLRFTWSLRQFNLVTIYLGAMPAPDEAGEKQWRAVAQAGRLMGLAGDNFVKGLRTYLFALPAILWLVHASLFMLGSVMIAGVTYWMDFHSKTLAAMLGDAPDEDAARNP
jgi:uncharacterized membrane protein